MPWGRGAAAPIPKRGATAAHTVSRMRHAVHSVDSVMGGRLARWVAAARPRVAVGQRARPLPNRRPPGTTLCYDRVNLTEENREDCRWKALLRPHNILLKALRNSGLKTV